MNSIKKETPTFVHSTHIRNGAFNACMVKEKIVVEHEDGRVEYKDNLKIYKDPKRSFYVTKPLFQNHQYKKEYEEIDRLERYDTPDSRLEETLKRVLGYRPTAKVPLKKLCDNPYVYGVDIGTDVLIRSMYKSRQGEISVKLTVGALDIENEIHGEQKINVITYIHEREVYTAVLEEYLWTKDPSSGERVPGNEQDILNTINSELGAYLKEHNFNVHLYVGDELEMIKWIFKNIHYHKTDFIGIWNMSHDIPHIIKRIEALGGDPIQIMNHQDIPPQYRYIKYHRDEKTNDFRDKWDWFECPGYSQFVDAMQLYARVRKAKGRDAFYNLDYISNKELKTGKLSFGTITNHTYEQKNNFLKYICYNINDVVLMMMLEFKNNDLNQLVLLTGVSMLKDFNKQTVMVKNNTFIYARPLGKIIASAGTVMLTPYDELLPKLGGAVANPSRTRGIGADVLEESSVPTYVTLSVNDLDVASMYPSMTSCFNISKDTKQSAAISIHGKTTNQMEALFGDVTSPIENAVSIGSNYFNLPNYSAMRTLFYEYESMRHRGVSEECAISKILEKNEKVNRQAA